MDLGIVAAIALIVVWAISTFMYSGPGWINLLLTLGVTILVWRVVARGAKSDSKRATGDKP